MLLNQTGLFLIKLELCGLYWEEPPEQPNTKTWSANSME